MPNKLNTMPVTGLRELLVKALLIVPSNTGFISIALIRSDIRRRGRNRIIAVNIMLLRIVPERPFAIAIAPATRTDAARQQSIKRKNVS